MKPRRLTEREQTLIDLYGYCSLGMTPQQFYAKWQVNQEAIAFICSAQCLPSEAGSEEVATTAVPEQLICAIWH
jgi:hypothetical protein